MKRFGLMCLLAMALASKATTQTNSIFFEDGNDLFGKCQSNNSADSVYCIAYIAGVADAIGGNSINGFRACIPLGATKAHVRDVVVGWLQSNPENRHHGAKGLIAAALEEAFPCP